MEEVKEKLKVYCETSFWSYLNGGRRFPYRYGSHSWHGRVAYVELPPHGQPGDIAENS